MAVSNRTISLENLYEFKQKIDETVKYKALYHLGEYDSVDTSNADYDLVSRNGGYETPESLAEKTWTLEGAGTWSGYKFYCYIPSAYATESDRLQLVINRTDLISVRGDIDTAGGMRLAEPSGSVTQVRLFMNVSASIDTPEKLKGWILSNGLEIQYKYSDACKYTERVLKNQPISQLDQAGENWLRGEYEKTLNLWDEQWEVGFYSLSNGSAVSASDAIRSKNKIEVKPGSDYHISSGYTGSGQNPYIFFYDISGSFLSYASGSSAGKGGFTTPSNCYYINFAFANLSTPVSYGNDIMLNKGDVILPYQPYDQFNGFLKNEYNKSVNLASLENRFMASGGITRSGQVISVPSGLSTAWYGLIFQMTLPAGTYTMSLHSSVSSGKTGRIQINDSFDSQDLGTLYVDKTISGAKGCFNAPSTFKLSEPKTIFARYCSDVDYNGNASGATSVAQTFTIMLNEGSTALPYKTYNGGSIMHAADVDGHLLWMNGNPSSSMGDWSSTSLPLSIYAPYTKLCILAAQKADSTRTYQYFYIEAPRDPNKYAYISFIDNGDRFDRVVSFQTTNTMFTNGRKNGSGDPEVVIPVAIYGIK